MLDRIENDVPGPVVNQAPDRGGKFVGTGFQGFQVDPGDLGPALAADQAGQGGLRNRVNRVAAHFGFMNRDALDQVNPTDGGPALVREGGNNEADRSVEAVEHAVHLGPDVAPHAGVYFFVYPLRPGFFQGLGGPPGGQPGLPGRQGPGHGEH